MTDDEIMEMAVKCYLISPGNREGFYGDALIQFAKLVAEAEREACAELIPPQYFELRDRIRARGQA